MFRRNWKVGLVVLAIFICWNDAVAQQAAQQQYLRRYQAAAERTVRHVLDRFRPNLTTAQLDMLSRISFRVPFDENVNRVVAKRSKDGRAIEISVGFISVVDGIIAAGIHAHFLSRQDALGDYVLMYVDALAENSERDRRGQPRRRIPSFLEYTNTAGTNNTPGPSSAQFQDMSVYLKVELIAFVTAHELGHHFLGHLDNRRRPKNAVESRRNEAEADEFAIQLSLKSGFNPLGSTASIMFFLALENQRIQRLAGRSHPHPACRASRMFEEGFAALKRDPNDNALVRDLSSRGFDKVVKELKDICSSVR